MSDRITGAGWAFIVAIVTLFVVVGTAGATVFMLVTVLNQNSDIARQVTKDERLDTLLDDNSALNNRLDELQGELVDRNAEHAQLSVEANELNERLRQERADEQALEDCVTLYSDDIRNGLALSQIAIADLFSAVVVRPAPLTDEEREAGRLLNVGLVEVVAAANDPLRAAVQALDEYKALDPPPDVCPHPNGG